MKTLCKIIFSFILIISVLPGAKGSAHTCTSGGENLGYVIDCNNHTGTSSINYKIASMDAAYEGYVKAGAKLWGNTNVVVFNTSAINTNNVVHTYTDPNTPSNAAFYLYSSDSSGHLIQWAIKLNKHKMDSRSSTLNITTVAHEFGHAIGLNDLKNTDNKNKLMYGTDGKTVSSPQAADILGAKKILGQ